MCQKQILQKTQARNYNELLATTQPQPCLASHSKGTALSKTEKEKIIKVAQRETIDQPLTNLCPVSSSVSPVSRPSHYPQASTLLIRHFPCPSARWENLQPQIIGTEWATIMWLMLAGALPDFSASCFNSLFIRRVR